MPLTPFSNEATAKIGTLDLAEAKEYIMPIQIDRVILNKLVLFKEKVGFIPYSYDKTNFVRANLKILFVDNTYNPIKYKWQNLEFEYILQGNLEYFLNTIIPFINWGLNRRKNEIDIILLFSILLSKRKKLENKNDFKHSYPYLSKEFLENIHVKQNFEFHSRVGRDDHAYEYTHLISGLRHIEEYYYLRLIAKELSENNIKEDYIDDKVDISYCSWFDNNAFRKPDCEYSEEVCNQYKSKIIERHTEFYNSFYDRFLSLYDDFEDYQNRNKYSEAEYESAVRSLRQKKEVLEAKLDLYKKTLMNHQIQIPDFNIKEFLEQQKPK